MAILNYLKQDNIKNELFQILLHNNKLLIDNNSILFIKSNNPSLYKQMIKYLFEKNQIKLINNSNLFFICNNHFPFFKKLIISNYTITNDNLLEVLSLNIKNLIKKINGPSHIIYNIKSIKTPIEFLVKKCKIDINQINNSIVYDIILNSKNNKKSIKLLTFLFKLGYSFKIKFFDNFSLYQLHPSKLNYFIKFVIKNKIIIKDTYFKKYNFVKFANSWDIILYYMKCEKLSINNIFKLNITDLNYYVLKYKCITINNYYFNQIMIKYYDLNLNKLIFVYY